MTFVIILVVLGVLVLAFIAMYNSLVRLNVRVDEAWSDITVQLKRRFDLIPNLVSTVKGYAKHEAETLERIAAERAGTVNGGSVKAAAEAENMLTGALKSVFAVAESNPDLKANTNFLQLQEELVDTEDKIQASRRFYNGSARDLNIKIKTFPTNIFANMLGFKVREFFEVEEAENATIQKPTEVKF
ncbi:LemA family protein [Candidatus Saccharibacteria bacterium]|nr:LemA family protein [Candidatus Saccharibacteria bacterium]